MNYIPRYKLLFIFSDVLIIVISLILLNVIGISSGSNVEELTLENISLSLIFISTGSATIIYTFRCCNLYNIDIILTTRSHVTSFLIASLILFLLGSVVVILSNIFLVTSYYSFVNASLLLFSMFLVFRIFLLVKIYNYCAHNILQYNVLIIGSGNNAKLLAGELFIENSLPINIIGCLSDELFQNDELVPGVKVLGSTSKLNEILSSRKIDEVVFCYYTPDVEKLLEQLDILDKLKVRVRISSHILKTINEKSNVEKYYDVPVLDIYGLEHRKRIIKYKRVFDLFFTLLAILFFLPIFVITSIAIKLTSKGPIIYKQTRIGLNGKPFQFYKFRSMTLEEKEDTKRKSEMLNFMSDKYEGKDFKVINENRLTKIGKVIRKTSIDELPQLFNVLKGDMSLVGPRPCLTYEYENYFNWQKKRLDVLPGCTGLWQIFGRNKVSFNDSTLMDVYYMYVMSPLRDLEYIIRTIPAMLFAKGR